MIKVFLSIILLMMPLVYLKQVKPEFSFVLRMAIIVFVSIFCINGVDSVIGTLSDKLSIPEQTDAYIKIAVKALGISLITQITADICRDCGENAVSTIAETLGKAFIIVLALPLVERLFELSVSILS